MKITLNTTKVIVALTLVCSTVHAQDVKVNAFQHYIRWVNEISLPRYIKERDIQDSVMQYASGLLSRRFNNAKVTMPDGIYVDYIEMMGKAKMAPMQAAKPGEIQVNIMTFVTRATVGFGVNWTSEVLAVQDGKTILQKKIPHEIEYFSRSGYISSSVWYTPSTYIRLYKKMLDELLTDQAPLPEKVVVGSIVEKEELIAGYVPGYKRAVVTAVGDFMGGRNFEMALADSTDTIARVRYKNGMDRTMETGPPGFGAQLLKGFTGLDFATQMKVVRTMVGRFYYDDGREIKLKIQFVSGGRRWTDGTKEYFFSGAPAVVDAYIEKELVSSMVYLNYMYDVETNSMTQVIPQTLPVGHSVRGRVGADSLYAEYEPDANIIRVFENKESKVALLLENAVEGSEFYSGTKMGKNKITISPFGSSKSKNEGKEAYFFYYKPGLSRAQLEKYMDVIMVLLFCKGNNSPA